MSRTSGRRIIMMVALAAVAASCSDDGTTAPPGGSTEVATVSLSPNVRHVVAWDSITMTASVKDAAGRPVSGKTVTWTSEHPNIATVSEAGVVAGLSAGQATIAATVAGKRATATVHVSWPPVVAVTLDATEIALEEGSTRQLVATPRDAQGRALSGLFIGFGSNSPAVAQVDAMGRITAIRPGEARITVTSQGRSTEATVTVTADHPYDLLYHAFDGTTPSLRRLDIRQASGESVHLFPDRDGANPVPSPDGTKIAFLSGGLDAGIWVANIDGSNAREVVIGSRWSPVYQPSWSPDGTRIAYTRRPAVPGHEQIWIVDLATHHTLVTTQDHPGGQSWPSWSPVPVDGAHRIAYAQLEGGRQQIWTMREDGTDRRQVTTGDVFDGQPAWSPDGQTIAFQRMTISLFDIWLVDANGGNARGLTGLYLTGPQGQPAWSPDGLMIAFVSRHETYGREGSVNGIYTVRLNGSGLARRTYGPGEKMSPSWIARQP